MSVMLAAAGCMAASATGDVLMMTVGDDTNNAGYSDDAVLGSFGSLSPATLSGVTVHEIVVINALVGSTNRLRVTLSGSRSQDFFASLLYSTGRYDTASADTYDNAFNGGTATRWEWNTLKSDPVVSGQTGVTFTL